ncbi:MAG TPA: glycoside hydrolase family 25 protein, partial [Streptosporangiaceae bacterium]|nr:glycoside hydrolase family 25 protein [Streptosporangiaceae bacterium]
NVPPFLDWCAARPMVEAATWFSWMWDQSPTLPTTVDAWGTPVERVIASWVPPVNGAADLDGVDASNHQGLVSWPQVAGSGRRFAFVKACEDPAYVDRYFPRNWSQARAAGLVVGAYSYARPSEASPAQSVTLLEDQIEAVGGLRTGDLVCLDIEDDRVPRGQNLLQWVAEWLDLAERTFGVTPVLYSGHWYMAPHGLEDPALGRYPLWYASYQETPPPPPVGWEKISFWQSSASGTVPGVAGPCDLDSFFGSEAELAALGYAGDEPPPSDEVQPLRDQVWQHADALQALAGDWEDAGWPSTASGIGSTAEALKTIIRGTQGER